MAEGKAILYEDLPDEIAVKLLSSETLERLKDLEFKGYNVRIPGYVCIPVKFSKTPAKRKEQVQELKKLGYSKVKPEDIEKYRLSGSEREFYKIPIKKLLEIHKVTI